MRFCAQVFRLSAKVEAMAMRTVAAMAALRRLAASGSRTATPALGSHAELITPCTGVRNGLPMQMRWFAAEPAPDATSASQEGAEEKTLAAGTKMGRIKAVSGNPFRI